MTRPTGGVVSAPIPHTPLKLLLSSLNQNENQPDFTPLLQVARTLSFERNFPLMTIPLAWHTTDGPDCLHDIDPAKVFGPPAPATCQGPAAVPGDGGSTLFPTNVPFEGRPLYPHVPLKL